MDMHVLRRFGAWTLALGIAVGGCAPAEETADAPDVEPDPGYASYLAIDTLDFETSEPADTIADTNWTVEDWRILEEKVRWGVENGLPAMAMGDALAAMGETFVGTTYTPGTLEAPGDEHLVINLRELDCVTFIENMLALTWLVRNEGLEILEHRGAAMRQFESYLTAVRYRDGDLGAYPSRLHYFSEWLSNNDAMGLVELRTEELGGVPDEEPITFMTGHRDAYRQLVDDEFFQQIQEIEERLNAEGPRLYIPEERIGEVADQIRHGDIIAATSNLAGLDVAHTGIAFRKDGRLHLMHAPLVGKNVEISELPLAERILDIGGQDGIMVATPQEWPATMTAGRP